VKALLITVFTLLSLSSLAVDSVTVLFLSRPKAAINLYLQETQFKGLYTEYKEAECLPYGDGCFHPQLGYIMDQDKVHKSIAREETNIEVKTINAEEVSLINCEDSYYFDIFCGKAKKEKAPANFELWIDVSSSLRQVDFSMEDNYCERRRFTTMMQKSCTSGLDVFTFNTSKKLMGSLDTLCLNHGTNDGGRMVDWLKGSKTKNVVIITDVDEYIGEFREYLDLIGAKVEGIGIEPIYAENLLDKVSSLQNNCK